MMWFLTRMMRVSLTPKKTNDKVLRQKERNYGKILKRTVQICRSCFKKRQTGARSDSRKARGTEEGKETGEL